MEIPSLKRCSARQSILLCLFVLSACTSKPPAATDSDDELFKKLEAEQVQRLRWLDTTDPEDAAHAAILKRDYRLMEVCAYACSIPATPDDQYQNLITRQGALRLQLGDVVFGNEHERLYLKAHDYAERYNREIQQQAPR
ncbi:hypothetical protein [Pseudomonas sp. ML96]|uniref:hypothetical protein n=1 Tax=Pseudomonas sp. ML96 TaxID=1523503 RepID=UPI0005BC74D3|nr:hypothetical protein [Pseudomonas sp. ML96]